MSLIFDAIKALKDKTRFHTPGHAGRLDKRDITELKNMFPAEYIAKAQQEAADFYGCRYLRFLTGGSSIGVKCAVMCADGDIIAPENAHRCIFDGAKLAGKKVFTVKNRTENGFMMPLDADIISEAMDKYKSAKAVVVTSPDYYGFTADVKSVRQAVKAKGLMLIADGAHGAHFNSRRDLFPESFAAQADFCNMSAHKTLRAYTQTAFLACNDDFLIKKTDEILDLLGTTSPSYLFLGQLEKALEYEKKYAGRYDQIVREALSLKAETGAVKNDDPLRIVIPAEKIGLSADGIYSALAAKGIYPEMSDGQNIVFIITLSNTVHEIKLLKRQLLKIKSDFARN